MTTNPTVPEIRIGEYTLANFSAGKVFIRHESGEGGAFNEHELAAIIDKFYKENF